MPNPINTAIGTQRQFSKKPENPYAARLITPDYGKGISMSHDGNAQALASALSGLGDTLLAGSIALDKRREKLGQAEAERIFAVTSEDDKEKLAALDLLGRSEQFDLADNPYAVARIDELRGQHLSTMLKNEYDNEVFPNSDLAANSQSNIKNFETFMDTKRSEFEGVINNTTAFDKGFYSTRPMDVLAQDAKYRKQKQVNLEADRDAAIASKVDDILAAAINKTPDDLANELQDIQTDAMLTGMSTEERLKFLNAVGKSISTNGSPEQIEAWGETIAYFDINGEPVRVKDRVPVGHYSEMANASNVALNEEKYRAFMQRLDNISSTQIDEVFEDVKLKDPSFYKSIAGLRDNIKKRKEQEEKKKQEAESNALKLQIRQNTVNSILDSRYNAVNAGKSLDAYGMPVTSSKMLDGKDITEAERVRWGESCLNRLAQQVNAGTISHVEAAKQSMALLSMPQLSPLVKSEQFKSSFLLSQLNPAMAVIDGVPKIPEGIEQALNMYRLDSSKFEMIFDKEYTADIATLCSLVDINGIQEGVIKFADYKANRNDPTWKDSVYKLSNDRFGDVYSGVIDVTSLEDGSEEKANFRLSGELMRNFRLNYEANLYCGQSDTDAYNNAMNKVASNYVSFKGCAIPKAFMYNIPSNFQNRHLAAFLEDEYKKATERYGEEGVNFTYVNGALALKHRNGVKEVWDKVSIIEAMDKWYKELPKERRVKVDDVYYKPEWDNSSYYTSNPDAALIEWNAQEAGIDLTSPLGNLISALGGN